MNTEEWTMMCPLTPKKEALAMAAENRHQQAMINKQPKQAGESTRQQCLRHTHAPMFSYK
jgi:hypothetical protein